VTTNNQDLAAF